VTKLLIGVMAFGFLAFAVGVAGLLAFATLADHDLFAELEEEQL
jgi:hypothetical protein